MSRLDLNAQSRPTRARRALTAVAGLVLTTALAAPATHAADTNPGQQAEPAPQIEPVRIMAFGDSITQGSGGDLTWRWFLDRHLRATDQPFDPGLGTLVADHRPDVLVINNSTNDLTYWNLSPARSLQLLGQAVADARAADPTLTVVLTEVIRVDGPGVLEFNRELRHLVEELDEAESRVLLAPAAVGFVPSTGLGTGGDTWDSVHPNTSGQQKIAAAVADALAQVGVGAEYPRPLPTVDEGPPACPRSG